jgi:uncharacterized membrane protein
MNPIKFSIKTEIIPLFFLLLTFASAVYFYQHFPEVVPVHWNISGEPDGFGSRAMGAFTIPAVALFMYLMFVFIPYFDPKKDRYEQFGKTYQVFKGMMVMFMALLYFFASMNVLGYNYRIDVVTPVMIGVLFIILGNYMSKIKPNWFMGIRTPWTMSSEENWNKTHRFGAKVFVLSGFLMAAMPFYPIWLRFWMFGVTLSILIFGTTGYSLYLYLKEKNGNNKE